MVFAEDALAGARHGTPWARKGDLGPVSQAIVSIEYGIRIARPLAHITLRYERCNFRSHAAELLGTMGKFAMSHDRPRCVSAISPWWLPLRCVGRVASQTGAGLKIKLRTTMVTATAMKSQKNSPIAVTTIAVVSEVSA